MAQDVHSGGIMGDDPSPLCEDGYLKVDTNVKEIIYHPTLNVILICTGEGLVRVLDVNSGVILQSTDLSAQNGKQIKCRYIPTEDRILFCDGQAIGARSDYNGVLLLDSMLQKTLSNDKETVKIEMLLSEAAILKQSLSNKPFNHVAYVTQILEQLQNVVGLDQSSHKKGIKAQKWNTACISVPVCDLKRATNVIVSDFVTKKCHSPELQVASALKERISELLDEQTNASDRKMMASEARRRESFSHWPHMDYKWALPEQMAQAGFYHQPNSSGDDRAMCFTCSVCLVSWERTDEPWGEHERHSPTCPFVVGEYTQNVPISVTNATGPAIDATFRGGNLEILGASSVGKLLPACTKEGLISVFDVSRKIKRTHAFLVTHFDSHILERITQDFDVPTFWNEENKKLIERKLTAVAIVNDKAAKEKAIAKPIRPTIVCGLTISQTPNKPTHPDNVDPTSDLYQSSILNYCMQITEDDPINRNLYLVVYDFTYNKEQEEPKVEDQDNKKNEMEFDNQLMEDLMVDQLTNIIEYITPAGAETSNNEDYSLIQELTSSFYKNLIPGESDTVYLPPAPTICPPLKKKSHTGPRLLTVDMNNTESDATSACSNLIASLTNGHFVTEPNEVSTISDHIVELKNNQSNKKLNYSRAVQCISLPDVCKNYPNMEIISISPTQDDGHILVTVSATSCFSKSFLLVYSLDFTNKMVKINENSVIVKELGLIEQPVEINLLPVKISSKVGTNGVEGHAVLVCIDGAIRIVDLATMKTSCIAKIEGEHFVSAAYCNSLDRLCASTVEGSLHFFVLNDCDNDSVDDHEEDDLFGVNIDNSIKELSSMDRLESIRCFKEPPMSISLEDLRTMQKLTHFVPVNFSYNVVVPPCWNEFQQAMRQRRSTLVVNTEAYTKTWRLQTGTTTWEEHIFEITLPTAVILGHVDVHFTLQTGCTKPCVEISLLRQTKNGIGHNKDVKFSVDDTVTIDMLRRVENPVVSEEYLRAHNADILAGPVNIAHHLDLTEQTGTVTLTSPRMFKVKVRNLLLHIRAVYDKDDKKIKRQDSTGNIIVDKTGARKNGQYLGCDSIHELSIAVYTPTSNVSISHERTLRNLMLDSNVFVQSLIMTAVSNSHPETLNNVLDILNWIAAIRLVPNRGNNGDAPNGQLEFMFINGIEDNMTGLLRQCLLLGGRSIAHKCMSYVMTCCRGAKNINKSIGDHFNTSVLNSLLIIMEQIKQVKSAAGLHWLFALLIKVVRKDTEQLVTSKCVNLLKEVSDDLLKRSNPYHLLLRSRYGLYGLPTEPELFDMDPPPFVKGSSSSFYTFSSIHTHASSMVPNDGSSVVTLAPDVNQVPNKEPTSSKEPTATDNKIKYKNLACPKLVIGLIETEPLHVTCLSSSEGTRLELADLVSANVVTAHVPSTVGNMPLQLAKFYSMGPVTPNKKEDLQQFITKYMEKNQTIASHLNEILGPGSNLKLDNMMEEAENTFDYKIDSVLTDPIDLADLEDSLSPSVKSTTSQGISQISSQATMSSFSGPSVSFNHNLPWQQLLIPPPKQVIVIERMHSGARRHVTLDFGEPVSLTDILIPSCADLVSLTIDVWYCGEELDAIRLVTASDIGTKNLILNDLQPPPLCKYMKITLVGRYGMTTTRCRIPLGYFYGHVIILPEEVPSDINVKPPVTDCEKNLTILSKLLEDISCRYSLACSKLKDYLHPFLVADMKNTIHLSAYINILRDKGSNVTNPEHNKILTTYHETLAYQHQLNRIRNVMSRIEASLPHAEPPGETLKGVSTDKLNSIAESLLEVLLSIDRPAEVSEDVCQQFFRGLCVSQSSRLQLLSAVFLEKSCGASDFWGDFLSNTIVELFSTSCTAIFPQDRLFVLLIYLSRKSPERSAVIDAAMRVVYDTLKPLEDNRALLLAVNVDLPLLSWLLMYLSLQLTFGKNQNDRWDWVLGEMVGKSNYNDTEEKKSSKPFHTTIWQKGPWCITKEFNPKALKGISKKRISTNIEAGKSIEEHSDPTSLRDLMMVPQKKPQYIDTTHCLAVSRILCKFIISMDHSGSADMMLLAFKIISRLVTMAKLQLCQLLTDNQLLELMNFSLTCKVPWAPFAISCFLQDALDLPTDVQLEVTDMDAMDISWSPTTSQNEVNVENEPPENPMLFMLDEQEQPVPKVNIIGGKINLPFSALPSVYETDSNDSDIDEMLEAFEKVKYTTQPGNSTVNTKPTVEVRPSNSSTSANSATIDARLESGVHSSSEIALRKLTNRNTQKLLQNIGYEKFKPYENPLAPWPESLGPLQQDCSTNNLKMLSFCFDELFSQMQTMDASKIENVLHLWLTLNSTRKDEKFDSSTMPVVLITVDAVKALISALAWVPGLSLTTWCLGLQTLTLVCNINNNGKKWFDLSGMADAMVSHRDFVQMFISLLSGNGVAFTNKNAAGPTLCKALHDFLVRLQVRCDVVSPSSKLGNLFKGLLLHVVYQLSKPGGSIATRTGHLDAQCKLLQSIQYLDFTNIDISIGMSTLECTAALLNSYFMNVDNMKCMPWNEKSGSPNLGHLFATVLGNDSSKQDRPIAFEDLLINLLKLLAKLVQTPISDTNSSNPAMDTDPSVASQTDESKAEQIQQMSTTAPCFADTVLQHHPTVVALCKCLANCKTSSLCMMNNVSQQPGRPAFSNFAEPTSVGDAVFHILSILAKKASRKDLIMSPLLLFLSQMPQLSEPLVWFIFQVLDNEDALRLFYEADGVSILARSIVSSSNTPSTISRNGTISTVMQHFNGVSNHPDAHVPMAPSSANKSQPASTENQALINYAPLCSITCQSVTSQPPDVLTQGQSGVTHRRARSPLWSYNYYQEETHTELLLQLPHAILLKEVQLQPHALGLATCPSFVAIEISASGPSRLVPACHPLPSSGLTFIRINLPAPKVVNCVLIRLYKPIGGNSIGLLQIRLLGASVFGKNAASLDYEEESYCNHSLGFLRLLHHCFTMELHDAELHRQIIAKASQVPNLLNTCCGLLLVPSYITPVYLPCLERLLRKLALLSPENGIATIRILLDNRLSIVEPMMSLDNTWQDRFMISVSGYQSACELLYQICEHQDANTSCRVKMILEWLEAIANECLETGNTSKCSAAYVSSIASILWYSNQRQVTYDLKSLITLQFFETIYLLKMKASNNSLRYALDSLLCSLCYNRSELFPLLLQKIGVLVPNLSSISDDRKGMTDDRKQDFVNSEWYSHLIIGELSKLNLTQDQLETVALASRSPTAIQQLLDSGLPKLLNSAICEFCNNNEQLPMAKLEKVTIILQFFCDVCDEKMLRDWLGSPDGSSFWPHLLHWLCKKPYKSSSIQSEAHVHLEEVCIKFLAKCCLCHPKNQARLATVLCEVIILQQNGISGFLRRLILQLLLENEKVPVSIEADEVYKFSRVGQVYIPAHPAFKQTYNRTMLYLATTTTLGDIVEQHLWFNAMYKTAEANRKAPVTLSKRNAAQLKDFFGAQDLSDISVAAGVTAKDKRAKDIKNMATATPQSKKKRYASDSSSSHDASEGRTVKFLSYSQDPLPLNMNLGQLLRLVEAGNGTSDWPYIHLTICQGKPTDDINQVAHPPISSALKVFSSMGGLALLAQHLPTMYPEAIRIATQEKSISDQSDSDWIKLEGTEPDDMCENMEEPMGNTSPKCAATISHIPPYSLTAFSMFLRLPGYAEVLLKDTKKALCLLRLMLGVTDDGEGGDIFLSSIATTLPTLPFEILQRLYDSSPLCSDDGRLLRKISISTGVVQLLLGCLGVLTHHTTSNGEKDPQKEAKAKEDRQHYWAKGTGFGTGSTQQSWNVEQALMKQKNEEEHVTVLLQVLASFINPNDEPQHKFIGSVLPQQFSDLLAKSSLLPAICSYLRNDSVLDMARHIPLYKAVLKILRALAVSSQLVELLLPQKSRSGESSVCSLLKNMKRCVDTYASKLQAQNSKGEKNGKGKSSLLIDKIEELEQGEGLATLMPDIQSTASLVATVTFGMVEESDLDRENSLERLSVASPEEQYLRIMKNLQFAAADMIEEQQDGLIKFVISHHFESMAKSTPEQSHPARVKRIAQETVTLSTSLPLSYSSSVFVRYDSSRLDVMKVLITGPADTPYANGCFELDVFFPPDYPMSPMLINLETTGHHTVRFNPNLYNDGKVCLSVLNTWHGRPEEKWNAQTSSFLQVLVSIQSLILVPEPYFNEPGYERARGSPAGTSNSKDYNLNICQATARWAMLDQIMNPCPCFKDVIHAHFYMKRQEILSQVKKWVQELENETKKEKKTNRNAKKNRTSALENFKKIYKQLEERLNKLKPPGVDGSAVENQEDEEEEDESPTTPTNSMEVTIDEPQQDKMFHVPFVTENDEDTIITVDD